MARLFILLEALIFLIGGLRSQTITITFEGTLNGIPTPLDSILVMNLTQGGDTTIYFPDHVLVLGTTGIGEAGSTGIAMQGLPNPFAGRTEVVLHAMGGAAQLALHDVVGRELVALAADLPAGAHRFRVSCERPGVHLLTVVQAGVRSTLRLMATEGAGVAGLSLLGGADGEAPKSDRSLFTWAPGDELRTVGHATSGGVLYSAAIQEVPVATGTRTFVLAAGAVCPDSPIVTDIDGHDYRAVTIGNQCWMAANLRTTRYRDGTVIPNGTDDLAWAQLTTDAWCVYENNNSYDATYGKLYNWYAAANPELCPQGWHVPTDTEWQQLEVVLGMPAGELGQLSWRGGAQNVGGKMKATTLWNTPNTGATDESGFSGVPGGDRYYDLGYFYGLGTFGYWWSASANGAENAWGRLLSWDNAGISRINGFKRSGRCVRCVRD